MKILDRFTRDRASRYLWGGFTIVFLLGIVWAAQRQRDALQQARLDAQARAVQYVQTTLFDNLDAKTVSAPILAASYRNLIIPVQAEIFTDPAVARLRIWSPTGELLFSSAERDLIGEATAEGNPGIQSAVQQGEVTSTLTRTTVAPKQGLEGSSQQLYETFVPLRVPDRLSIMGAAEIDQTNALIVAGTDQPWRNFQIFFGIGVFICAVFALLSLRKARALVGAEVMEELPVTAAEGDAAVPAAKISSELQETKDQLRQAVEAAAFLEGKLKEARAATAPSQDDARVADLELQLQAARTELEAAREASAPGDADLLQELTGQIAAEQVLRAKVEQDGRDAELAAKAEASKRIAELEQQLREIHEQPADQDRATGVAASLASEVEAIKAELDGARAQADASKFEAQAARAEADRARTRLAEAHAKLAQLESERGAPGEGLDRSTISALEERVADAEHRASEAERYLDEMADEDEDAEDEIEVDPAVAEDLRARLARTAAKKRLSVHDEPDDNAGERQG